jgi:hypothetical protein
MNCKGDCLVSTDLPDRTDAMHPKWTSKPDELAHAGDPADGYWDDPLPPISSSDGRYGLLHRDLIWDCLGPAGDCEPLSHEDEKPATGFDRDDRHLPVAMRVAVRGSELTDEMDFDRIDPAYVASMGLQPSEPGPEPEQKSAAGAEQAPLAAASTCRIPPTSPVVVENEPAAADDNWWSHPDDERIDF